MGNVRATLPGELHDLVRDAVAELESAAGGLDRARAEPRPRAPRRERRRAPQADILRLPDPAEPPPRGPVAVSIPAPPPPAPAPFATALPVPAVAPRRRAFLARLEVASTVPSVSLPARTRRLPVACRRASPLDAARISRMLRVAVPATPVAPATLTSLPAWLLAMAPARPAPGPAVTETAPAPARAESAPIALPVAVPVAVPKPATEEQRPVWRAAAGHVSNLLIAAALSLVGIFCCIVVGLVVTGHHLEEVVTGSMQPTIPIGSLVATERLPASQLQVGNILVFPDPNDTKLTIVHRIVWLSHDQSGDVLVRTKGDYNALPDSWTLKRPATSDADRVFYIIPGGGTVAGYLQTLGFWGLIVLLVGVIGYYGIRKVRQILGEDVAGDDAGAAPEPT
ncbi:MAG: signal peptidase I [Candidatus Dormibacteria bacterium]